MENSDLAARLAGLSPAKRALLEQKLRKSDGGSAQSRAIPRRIGRDPAPLSFAQQRLWFLSQVDPEGCDYNEANAVRLIGPLNTGALGAAFEQLVARHESLRTTIAVVNGEPRQFVSENTAVDLPIVEVARADASDRYAAVDHILRETIRRPFDLSRDVPLRLLLLRLGHEEHVLLKVLHHIASDAWSSGILWRELSFYYRKQLTGNSADLEPLPIQYQDYAEWQRNWLQGDVLKGQLDYWKGQLQQMPVLSLPTDKARVPGRKGPAGKTFLDLDPDLSEQLRQFSKARGVTLFMTLIAAFQVLLHRYTNQDDIVVGYPIAGRTRPEVEGLVGFFVNTLLLRLNLAGDPTFEEVLIKAREMALGAYAHQDIPFERIVEEINPARSVAATPLFQVMFAHQNVPRRKIEMEGLEVSPIEVSSGEAKFDWFFAVLERDQGLALRLEYAADLFHDESAKRLLEHYRTLLKNIVGRSDRHLSEIDFLTDGERHRLLVEWNDTRTDYPRDRCIHHLFDERTRQSPDSVALVFEEQQLTYGELNRRANRLAHYLLKQGVGHDVRVGVCLERSLEIIVALLGVLKTGAAYVPLDPAYPSDRLGFMLQDAGVPIVLANAGCADKLPAGKARTICLESASETLALEPTDTPVMAAVAEQLAYVMYTSGSTGTPKGVEITHRGVVRLVVGSSYAQLDASQTFLQLAPFSFDASTFEIWGALLHGAKCVLAPPVVPTPAQLESLLSRHKVSVLWLTSSFFNLIIDQEPRCLAGVRQLLIGGEALSQPHVKKALSALPHTRIINGYGPTECTTFACCFPLPQELPDGLRSIPIGRPIANTEVYILDPYRQLVPVGVAGELYIGGDGLARGYLNRPELNTERFAKFSFRGAEARRLYRTGDRARYLPDGNIEFLGRLDNQVKLRGFRIELGEVEAVLSLHPAVKDNAVVVEGRSVDDKHLVAYLTARIDPPPLANEMRLFLKERVPSYMIPTSFVFVDELPLSANGKVDRKALLAMASTPAESISRNVASHTTATEEIIALMWCEVLKVDRVDVYDNFFELGGHSLLAVKLFAQIRQHLGIELPLHVLFETSTLRDFAAHVQQHLTRKVDDLQQQHGYTYLVALKAEQSGTPVFCFSAMGDFDGDLLRIVRLAHIIGPGYSFYGFRAPGVNGTVPSCDNIQSMVADYISEMRAIQPKGPYYLIGECFSGRVAYETARQLRQNGEQVALLALLDSTVKRVSRMEALRLYVYRMKEMYRWRRHAQRLTVDLKKPDPSSVRSPFDDEAVSGSMTLALKAYHLNVNRYRARRYDGKVTLFINEQWKRREHFEDLGRLVRGQIEIRRVPGNHDTYITKHIHSLADELRSCLENARREYSQNS